MEKLSFLPQEFVENHILLIRGKKVMLDYYLAELYGVETKVLNKAVSRNLIRFPEDFMFRLTLDEWNFLRFQFGTSKAGRGGRRYLPFAFTEHGAIMLASVLNSPRAIEASIYVVRAFVLLRGVLASHKDLAQKLEELESKIEGHSEQIRDIIEAINQLVQMPEKPKPQIGFRVKEPKLKYPAKLKK
jgi:hypothetical protein